MTAAQLGTGGRRDVAIAHYRCFDPSSVCFTTLSGTVSPRRSVKTVFRLNPRSSSTTTWLWSRAIRQGRDDFGPPPVTARRAGGASSPGGGGSARHPPGHHG